MTIEFAPTIIVVHPRENRAKCSVETLRGRPEFQFYDFPVHDRPPLDDYVRLAVDGPPLSSSDARRGLLVLDATWRWAEKMTPPFADVPARSLPGWETAYPRVSKWHPEPLGGLATIEAIFAAFAILGRPADSLLDAYRWRSEFLGRNATHLTQLRQFSN